ncbi:hypothetical protein BB561_000035 [Smittium simulii]|uniref:Uncharacterized protein n=1 Tax=Smittium simulii TaxID=133385 RepID=A0A2T9Z169_9FUNG|nr:hypothetical protein BB561_000035 [Smittium simulii]
MKNRLKLWELDLKYWWRKRFRPKKINQMGIPNIYRKLHLNKIRLRIVNESVKACNPPQL